jgi:biopolymer transport protein ExbD
MRFAVPARRRGPAIGLNLATMLDATFLLLAYFLVTAATEPRESRLESSLALAGEPRAADLEPAVLEVAIEGGATVFRLGQRVLRDPASLREALGRLDPESPIRLLVRPEPRVEAVASALQAIEDAGFREVAYAPSP